MDTTPTASTTPAQPIRRIVREYASLRVFHQDARELYARAGYTVSNTAGLSYRGLRGALAFYWPHQRHLIITYDSPTNPRHAPGGAVNAENMVAGAPARDGQRPRRPLTR